MSHHEAARTDDHLVGLSIVARAMIVLFMFVVPSVE